MNTMAGFEFSVLLFIKIATTLFLLLYLIFAAVVIKQARVMTETLEVGFETPIKALTFLHFLFALAVFFLTLIVLY